MGIINRCSYDCSGTLNYLQGGNLFTAIIYTQYDNTVGSSVTITRPNTGEVIFESSLINPSSCVTTEGGTSLVASGEGLANGLPVAFTICLQESIRGNGFEIYLKSIDNDGDLNNVLFYGFAPDDALTINECP